MYSKRMMRGLSVLAYGAVVTGISLLAPHASAGVIYAIDDQNNLFTFDSTAPQNIETAGFVSLPGTNEHLINIDFRPSNGTLYGLSSAGKVYTISVTPAAVTATAVGAGSFGPISGNSTGMDVDPVNDNIRFSSDTDINDSISPTTGLLLTNTPNLSYGTSQNPSIVGLAYTNSKNPAPASTTLYGIDSVSDSLVQVNQTSGLLTKVGSGLGVDTNNFVGFDISQNNVAFAALQTPTSSVSDLYSVNLTTGVASDLGRIIGGVRVEDIATEPGVDFVLPEPGSILALGAMSLGMCLRRRRA